MANNNNPWMSICLPDPKFKKEKKTTSISPSDSRCGSDETQLDQTQILTLVTWNIDGLEEKNRTFRTQNMCQILKKINPDVLFFQEVSPESESIIGTLMLGYQLLPSNINGSAPHYTLIGVRQATVKLIDHRIINFEETQMNRNLNEALVKVGKTKIRLMTSHLESGANFSLPRKKQLSGCFKRMEQAPQEEVVIFGGDLNLKDWEYAEVGSCPRIKDVWEATGSRKDCQYTWDMLRNDNHMYPENYYRKNRCFRFDRVYLRDFEPSRVSPEYFGLIGLERLKPNFCFPSDHWGILSVFKLINRVPR